MKKIKRKITLLICYILVMSLTISSVSVFAEGSIGLLPVENVILQDDQEDLLPNDGADISSQLPENETGDSSQLPEDGNQLPEDGNQLPEDGNQLPEDGEQLPDNGEQLPEDGAQLPEDLPNQLPVEGTLDQSQDLMPNSGTVTSSITYGSDTILSGGVLIFKDINVATLNFRVVGSSDTNRKITFKIPKGLELVSGTGISSLDANGNTIAKGYTPSEIFMFGYNYPVWKLDPKEPVVGILPTPNPIMNKSGTLEYTMLDDTDGASVSIKVKTNRDFVNYNLNGQLETLLNDIEVSFSGASGSPQHIGYDVKAIAEKGRLSAFALSVASTQFPARSTDLTLSYQCRHPYDDTYIQNTYNPEFDFTFSSKAALTLASSWAEISRKDNGDNTTTVRLKYSGLINLSNVVFGQLFYDSTNFPINTKCEVKLENLSYSSLFYDNTKAQLGVSAVNQPDKRSATTTIIEQPLDFVVGFKNESGYVENFLENNTDPVLLFSAVKSYIKGNLFYADIKFRGDFEPDVDNITKVVMGMPVLGTPPGYNMYDLDKYPYFKKITVKYSGEAPIDLYSGTGYNMSGTTWAGRSVSIAPNAVYSMVYYPYGQAPSQVTFTAPTGKSFEWIEVELNGDRNTRGDLDAGFYVYGRPKTDNYTGIYSNNYFSIYTKNAQGDWATKATSKIGGYRWKNPSPTFVMTAREGAYDANPYLYSQAEYNFLGHNNPGYFLNPVVGLMYLKGYTGVMTTDEIKISIAVDEQDAVRVIRFPYGYKSTKEEAIKQVKEVKWEYFDDPTPYVWINGGGTPPFTYDTTGGTINALGQIGGPDEKRFKSLEVTLDGWGSSSKESSISLNGYLKGREVTGILSKHKVTITAKSQGGQESEIYSGTIGRKFLPQTSATARVTSTDDNIPINLEINAGASGTLNFRVIGDQYNKQTIAMVLPKGITVGTVITNIYDPVKKKNFEMIKDDTKTRDLTPQEIKTAFGTNTAVTAATMYVFNLENQNINAKVYYSGVSGWTASGYSVTADLKVAPWYVDATYNMSQILYAGTNQTGVNSFGLYVANEGKNIDNFISLGQTSKIVTGRDKDILKININPGISVRADAAGSDKVYKTFIAGNNDTSTILRPSEVGTVRYTIANNINMMDYVEKTVYLFLPVPSISNKAFASKVDFDLKMTGAASVTSGSSNADKIEFRYTTMNSSNITTSDREKYFIEGAPDLASNHNVVIVKMTNVTYSEDQSIVIEIPVVAPDKTIKTAPDQKIYTNMAPKYMFPFSESGNYVIKDLYQTGINNPIQFGFYNPEWIVNFANVIDHGDGTISDMTNPVIANIKVINNDPIYSATASAGNGKPNKLPNDPTLTGYNFRGWYIDNNLQTPFIAYDGTNDAVAMKITKNTTIYAKWEAATANYKVKHWREDASGNTWSLHETEILSDKIGERPPFFFKTYDGFVRSKNPTTYEKTGTPAGTTPLTIAADGSLVVNLYYDLLRHNVTYLSQTGLNLQGVRNIVVLHGEKPSSVPTVTADKDYVWLDKWLDGDNNEYTTQDIKDLKIDKNIQFTAVSNLLPLAQVVLDYDGGKNTDTNNTSDTREGSEGSAIPFPTKDKIIRNTDEELIGWEVQSTITWDSSKFGARGTNVTYKAKYGIRGVVSFNMNAPDSSPSNIPDKSLFVGDKLTSSSFWPDVSGETESSKITRPGYAFAGWYTDNKLEDIDKVNDTTVMSQSKILILYAKWIPGQDTPYKLIHHKEQLSGSFITEEQSLKGETGGFAAVIPKSYTGYIVKLAETTYENSTVPTPQKTPPLPIIADGSLKVNLYYYLKDYNVQFSGSNATLTGTTDFTIKHGDKVSSVPTVTPNANYEWNGNWSGSDGKTYTSTQIRQLAITDNITFTATATLKEYNVKFLANNATLTGTADFTVKHGDKVSTVPTVTPNANYAWNGNWSGSDGKTYTSTQIRQLAITDNITFTATATLKEYNVKFLANNATLTGTADFTVKHGDKVSTVPTVTPNANYAWNGNWSGSDGKTYTSTQIGQLVITDNITFTATATLKEYNVKFLANNATLTGTADFTVKHGDKVSSVPTVTPNANYAWNGNWSGSDGKTYTSTQIGQLVITDNITFTATATLKEYNVKFLANNATLTGTADFTVKHGDKVSTVPTVTPNANYEWNGNWSGSDGKTYTSTQIGQLVITDNITFTATATLKEYNVKFLANNASLTGTADFTVKHGDKVGSVPTVTPNANYEWNGNWSGSDGKTYTSTQIGQLVITDNITFTATATLKEYNVKFLANNASLTGTADFTVKHGDKVGSVPTVTPNANYEWNGNWSGSDGKTYTSTQIGQLVITDNITFTATATLKEYNVKFLANNASLTGTANFTVKHGDSVTAVPTVTEDTDYQWNGKWRGSDGADYTSDEIKNLAITDNIIFTATATLKALPKVKLDFNGGISAKPAEFDGNPGDTITFPTKDEMTRDGYELTGWTPDGSITWDSSKFGARGTIAQYTAAWTIKGKVTFTLNATDSIPDNISEKELLVGDKLTSASFWSDVSGETPGKEITRHGYVFGGWYTDALFANKVDSNTVMPPSGKLDLYAKWIPPTPISDNITVKNQVTGNPETKGTFSFILTPKDASNPMPLGSSNGQKKITIIGEGTNSFGEITFVKEGIYVYSIIEEDTKESGYTYDQAKYVVTFNVKDSNNVLQVSSVIEKDGKLAIDVIFTNAYETPSSGGGGGGVKPEAVVDRKVIELNSSNHFAYVSGYADGSFAPDKAMTRAEVAVIFSNLIIGKAENTSRYVNFNDTNQNEWYADKVGHIVSLGIMGGYPDGSFRPYDKVTRAEFATIASNFDQLAEKKELSFTDISKEHWAYDYISKAISRKWVVGYEDGSFRPENGITRAEVVVVANNMLGRQADKIYIGEDIKGFKDLNKSHWAYYPIMEASISHEYTRDENNVEVWSKVK